MQIHLYSVAAADKRRKTEEAQQSGPSANGSNAHSNGGPSVSFLLTYYSYVMPLWVKVHSALEITDQVC